MASVFNASVEKALANQSWFTRRKDTLTAIAGTILQIANLGALYASNGPEWVNILIAGVIGAAQIVIHAGTKGAITPSMAGRLEQAGAEANLDLTSVSGVAVTSESEPVDAVEEFPPYEGAHRLED
ncbi:hypothetical protein [uncultured Corynebacterium sp.]|uniref:hypothetical protein n=1 Tax=uncultured Corynebacterium sp. TaxID=159447 RepID=UPI0025E5F225|nr:hypothetical protein [uncultured Corynebacterium sp.]